jgi:hypothetical protein
MNTNTTTTRQVGSKVGVDDPKYPGVWIVKSNGPVNATLTPETGGRGLRCPHYMLTDPPTTATNGATVTAIPVVTYYDPGTLIRIADGRYAGLWVVIADKAGDKVNLAKLGGDGGRYLRYPRRGLTKVAPEDVLA